MKAKLKGKLLEIIVKRIISACGFQNVKPDGTYVDQKGNGLQWVNGKGSRHDADVLLEPPFQMPFSFPSRLIVECKSYDEKSPIGLPIVRNALGLREDVNNFEIVTKDHLMQRKNNRRAQLAIEQRERFFYDVAVASISGFTKPAIEFAFNNKIALIDISAILPNILSLFSALDNKSNFSEKDILDKLSSTGLHSGWDLPEELNNIAKDLETVEQEIMIGVLNSGYVLFLSASQSDKEVFYEAQKANTVEGNTCTVHFEGNDISNWFVLCSWNNKNGEARFKLPKEFFEAWASDNYSSTKAIDIKEKFMHKMTLYTLYNDFQVIINMKIPQDWFNAMRKLTN